MERKKEMLTEVGRRRVHVPEEAKVGAAMSWSKFKIPHAENGQTTE
jgi:hypothetical protein